jgi:hypothetical protein
MPASSPSSQPSASRPWEEIANELTHETNPQRVVELSEELTRALDERGLDSGEKRPDRTISTRP